jgi:hypothetical protein
MSVLIQVCTLTAEDSCDPVNGADWASSATVYNTTIRWRVVITNTGTGPLTGIYVTSSLIPKQSDCAGPVKARQLKAGAVVAYECESDHISAPATIVQAVTVSADPPTGPFVTPASSAATARLASSPQPVSGAISARLQVCILPKQALCDPTKAVGWASSGPLHQQTAVWRVLITNTGTVSLSNIYETDAAGTLRRFRDGQPGPGAVTEWCHTDKYDQTTTNTVTATGDLQSGAPVTSPASNATAVVNGSG